MRLRPSVAKLAELMEKKLRKHDGKKGVDGWKQCTTEYLLERLRQEYVELEQAIKHKKPKDVLMEAVDVANFAMMIAEVRGNMMYKKPNALPSEDCQRHVVVIGGQNFYLQLGSDFVDTTVPYENTPDNAKLREIVDEICNAITRAMGGEVLEDLKENQNGKVTTA